MKVSLITSVRRSINYRLGRLYNSFYYSQSNNKYVMVFAFPAFLWYIRYRADTKLGYRLYISPTALGPLDYLDKVDSSKETLEEEAKEPSVFEKIGEKFEWLTEKVSGSAPLVKNWTNGKKIYLPDDVTVSDLKRLVYGNNTAAQRDVLVGCKGRIMNNDDNLALATRAFCKRDPRLVLWREGRIAS
ncbi:hypothetical protein BEWA_006800 [Theileria equi strain WA]|uniref:Uncharacterized protein n=1 Tax=Theileria equi strain WA TaxID=1537102 RepID=L0B1Z8_THEEQ|nr:hypothetical protein BEWA_006800 [Theileria equi strain WA]AFZ81271.1 hypothetical protein BEWA_006800 [Theileria equi strain WA]|eukprot:XP_004830937.1 hypothetical protein BEWA_006800 [Theileria equi strain WA]